MCSDVAEPLSSDSGELFELSDRSNTSTFTIFPASSSTVVHLGFVYGYNYHTAFQGVSCHHA